MQFRPARVLAVAVLCAVVAGCGGSHTSSVTPSGGTLKPQLNGGTGSLAQPTLYVSGQGSVYAYDLTASGDTAPVTSTTGYYYSAGGVSTSIAGIATNAPGDLVVLQNYGSGAAISCQLIYIPARTGTSPTGASNFNCDNNHGGVIQGTGIGVTFTGQQSSGYPDDIDVLMNYLPSGNTGCDTTTNAQWEVDRYTVSGPSGSPTLTQNTCVPLASERDFISGSTNGAFFVDQTSGGFIERYDVTGSVTNSDAPGSVPAPGAIAVSANPTTGVGYRVVASNTGGITTVYSFKNSGAGFTFTHALGTFTNTIGALAVDNDGNIFVGVNQPNGVTKVKVYNPTQTQATSPDRVLNNPVRRPNPATPPAALITGIAIAQ